VGFNITDQLLMRFFFLRSSDTGKKWTVYQLFIALNKSYDSIRSKELYNILIEFGVSMKLVRPIKMRLNETCSKVPICKHWSVIFLSKMV
jgi:hypothetical protein